jgi:hypothetical protein
VEKSNLQIKVGIARRAASHTEPALKTLCASFGSVQFPQQWGLPSQYGKTACETWLMTPTETIIVCR